MTCLVRHGVRVDLAHVLSAVLLLDLGDEQVEGGREVAGDGDAPVVRDDGVVDRLDRLRVRLHPGDLKMGSWEDSGIEMWDRFGDFGRRGPMAFERRRPGRRCLF